MRRRTFCLAMRLPVRWWIRMAIFSAVRRSDSIHSRSHCWMAADSWGVNGLLLC